MIDERVFPNGKCPQCYETDGVQEVDTLWSKDMSTKHELYYCDPDEEWDENEEHASSREYEKCGCGFRWIQTHKFKMWEETTIEEFPDEED